MEAEEQREGVESTLPEGPGARLREARSLQQLTVQEVASRLRLTPDIVEALEDNDCQPLPAPTFVRGYLRSYARLLRLDEQQIVCDYNAVCGAEQAAALVQPKGERLKSGLQLRAIAAGLVAIGLVVVAVLFVLEGGDQAVPVAPQEGVAPQAMLQLQQESTQAPTEVVVPAVAAPAVTVEAVPLTASEATPETTVVAVATESEVTESEASPPVAQEPVVEVVPSAAAESTLELHFDEESWIEVHDGEGVRRAYGLGRPGRSRSVAGQGPFKVFLGNAAGVRVVLDGKEFDHSAYHHGNLARFELGGER